MGPVLEDLLKPLLIMYLSEPVCLIVSHFHPSLIFSCKAWFILVRAALLVNIRQGWHILGKGGRD
jgi:positive regulator of sigma E activity